MLDGSNVRSFGEGIRRAGVDTRETQAGREFTDQRGGKGPRSKVGHAGRNLRRLRAGSPGLGGQRDRAHCQLLEEEYRGPRARLLRRGKEGQACK